MQNIERQVWREAQAMTRREVITKAIARQLSWVQAAEIVGAPPHMRSGRQRGQLTTRLRASALAIRLLYS